MNPVTNKVYVTVQSSQPANLDFPDTVTVLDGATNATSTMTVGSTPTAVAVNPMTTRSTSPSASVR